MQTYLALHVVVLNTYFWKQPFLCLIFCQHFFNVTILLLLDLFVAKLEYASNNT